MATAKSASVLTRRKAFIGGTAALAAGAGFVGLSIARMGSAQEYDRAMKRLRAPLGPDADARELVRYATLAANSHNTQPWRFRIAKDEIRILPDFSRRTPAVDPDDHHLYASLGCAAENLSLATAAAGLPGELTWGEDGASIFSYTRGSTRPDALSDATPRRQTTRSEFDGRSPPSGAIVQLETAARLPGVEVVLLTDRAAIGAVRDLVIAGNTAQIADAAFVDELKAWIRFNPRAALMSGDGIASAASGNPALPTWAGRLIFPYVFTADAENPKYERQLATSAGVAVFLGEKADPEHWMQVGRACQRFALQASALGMKTSFINQPVEVERYRADLASIVGVPGRRPDIVMRFGYGAPMPMSPRRPVQAVIEA